MTTGADTGIPGWFGKIPNLGDFASRRLPPRFLEPWDDWLQRSLAESRAALGSAWLDLYLTSPVWRYLLFPGVCGDAPWAGVLMPSVDRVGRYFPLTIAAELQATPCRQQELSALSAWLDALEHTALAMLDVRHTSEDLDATLQKHPIPSPDENPSARALAARLSEAGGFTTFPLRATELLGQVLADAATARLLDPIHDKSLWWSQGRDGGQPLLVCCDGLPASEDFAVMLDGRASPGPAFGSSSVGGPFAGSWSV